MSKVKSFSVDGNPGVMAEKKARRFSEPGSRRAVRRPEEVLRDVRGLKLRQRVSVVLGDAIVREELEEVVKNTTVNGVSRLDSIRAFQDFLLPTSYPGLVSIGRGFGSATVLPVNDLRGDSKLEYSKSERVGRCALAAVYRLVDLMGWSEGIYNHISLRVSKDKPEFLINPFGLLYCEVSASSLVKIDHEGNIIDPGSTSLGINKAGYVLHSTIHEFRPDINCIIHAHSPNAVAVSSMKCGFLKISQEALIVGHVSYHDYCGIVVDESEKKSIQDDLGPTNMVMFLRNHGVVVCGKSVESAFHLMFKVMSACDTQVRAVTVGVENLHIIGDEAFDKVQAIVATQGTAIKMHSSNGIDLETYFFEAYMRWMDAQGYRTGYAYHMPDIFVSPKRKPVSDAVVPPQATSTLREGSLYTEYNQSSPVRRAHSMGTANTYRNRVKWLNSPVQGTQYSRERELDSTPPTYKETDDTFDQDEDALVDTLQRNAVEANHVVKNGGVKIANADVAIAVADSSSVIPEEAEPKSKAETKKEVPILSSERKVENGAPQSAVNGENGCESPTKSLGDKELSATSNTSSSSELHVEDGGHSPTKVKKKTSFRKGLIKKFKKESKERAPSK